MKSTHLLVALALSAFGVACSGNKGTIPIEVVDSDVPPDTSDAADSALDAKHDSKRDQGAEAHGDAGDCNTISNDGEFIPLTAGAGSAPTMTGGTIVDGTYQLTKFEVYDDNPSGISYKTTLAIAGDTIQRVQQQTSSSGYIARYNATYVTSGSALTQTHTCPSVLTEPPSTYTATTGSLTIAVKDKAPYTLVYTYTKK